MKITIHRGTNQIGGCVTEYEYKGWHLFVDYGEELPGGPKTGELQVEGLIMDKKRRIVKMIRKKNIFRMIKILIILKKKEKQK